MKSIYPVFIESDESMMLRIKKFKREIANFINEKNIKDNELLIVGHSNMLRNFTA